MDSYDAVSTQRLFEALQTVEVDVKRQKAEALALKREANRLKQVIDSTNTALSFAKRKTQRVGREIEKSRASLRAREAEYRRALQLLAQKKAIVADCKQTIADCEQMEEQLYADYSQQLNASSLAISKLLTSGIAPVTLSHKLSLPNAKPPAFLKQFYALSLAASELSKARGKAKQSSEDVSGTAAIAKKKLLEALRFKWAAAKKLSEQKLPALVRRQTTSRSLPKTVQWLRTEQLPKLTRVRSALEAAASRRPLTRKESEALTLISAALAKANALRRTLQLTNDFRRAMLKQA